MNSIKIYEMARHRLEEAYQAFLDENNEGKPSTALRYVFLKEAVEFVEANPHLDALVQDLMVSSLIGERNQVRELVTIKTIRD